MTNEEREKQIRIANMLIGTINDLKTPMLMYQVEKDVAQEALENYIKMLVEQQPNRCDNCIHSEEQDGLNCYECVKGIADNFEAQPTDADCISRQAVLDCVRDNYRRWFINDDAFMHCVNEIKNIVPVTPQPKIGKWINEKDVGNGNRSVECSNCGAGDEQAWLQKVPYCWKCGAKMEVEE